MFRNKITEQEGLQLPTGSAVMSEPPGPEVATTSGTGESKSHRKSILANDDAAERVEVAAGFGADDAAADGVVEEGGGERGGRGRIGRKRRSSGCGDVMFLFDVLERGMGIRRRCMTSISRGNATLFGPSRR